MFHIGHLLFRFVGGGVELCVAILLFLVGMTQPSFADRRVALVIGNGDYLALGRLANPTNDASDIAAALGGMGFDVTLGTDVDEDEFATLLDHFAANSRGADVALFFFAGHGIQFQNENHLVPVDAKLETRLSLKRETLGLSDVIEAMGGARVSLVFVDACRSFPIEGTFFGSAVERITPARGLAPVEPAPGTFIGFSASAGQTASDGSSRNSPFASALLEFLPRGGLSVPSMFQEVSGQVRAATRGAQIPQSWANLSDDVFLVSRVTEAPVRDTAGGPSEEERLYLLARDLNTSAAYRAFLARYPGGFFAELAKQAIAALSEQEIPPPAPHNPDATVAPRDPAPANECDRLAAHDLDPDAVVKEPNMFSGGPEAEAACASAVKAHPEERRFAYQYARALLLNGKSDEALPHLETASNAGSLAARGTLALMRYSTAATSGAPEAERLAALQQLKMTAEAGSLTAKSGLGWSLAADWSPDRSIDESHYWLEQAALGGDIATANVIANAYLDGERGYPKNQLKWLEWRRVAADHGAWGAMCDVGMALGGFESVTEVRPDESADMILKCLKTSKGAGFSLRLKYGEIAQSAMKAIQSRLKQQGYYSGAVDGVFGERTRAAMAAYAHAS